MNSETMTLGTTTIGIIVVLAILTILHFLLYFGGNVTKEDIEKPSIQSYVTLAINSVGILTLFLPWVKIPFLGSFNALELLKYIKSFGGEETSDFYNKILATLCVIVANYIVFIITSIDKIRSKTAINSGIILYFEVLNPLLVVLFFIILIINISVPLVGIAPYLIIVLGVAQAITSIFLKETHHENVMNEKETVKNEVKQDLQIHQDKMSQLQQLKQLFDDGILTEQEFDEQKSKILKK